MIGEKAHEKLVAKLAANAGKYLEAGETVKDALTGQTEAPPHSQLMGMIVAVRMITGKLQARLVILTDRNVYVAHSSTLHPATIKEILSSPESIPPGPPERSVGPGRIRRLLPRIGAAGQLKSNNRICSEAGAQPAIASATRRSCRCG